jgi:hypothetical protein
MHIKDVEISFHNNMNPTTEIGTFESCIKYLMYNSMNENIKFDIYKKVKYNSILNNKNQTH